jgi:excisionase family DNA binding protein
MSSNIRVQRICQQCNGEFTAKTTVTKYCSVKCASRASKARARAKKVKKVNAETQVIINQPIELINAKEYLSVKELSILLGCSIRTVYRLINDGTIAAVNIGERMTRIKKSSLEELFEGTSKEGGADSIQFAYDIKNCLTLTEAQDKYGISQTALQNIVRRHSIPKLKKGAYAYIPKIIIDKIINNGN